MASSPSKHIQSLPAHLHRAVAVLAVSQLNGSLVEIRRTVCSECKLVLDEEPIRREAA